MRTDRAPSVVAAIDDEAVAAPDLLGPEVLSTLRGLERGGKVTIARAETALRRFERAPVQTIKTGNLLGWALGATSQPFGVRRLLRSARRGPQRSPRHA